MVELEFQQKTKELIDSLKGICANYGLGNDGNEFKNRGCMWQKWDKEI